MGDPSPQAGIIYVLTNEAMPGMVKIGLTSRETVSQRVAELSRATGVPLAFQVEAAKFVENVAAVERAFHQAFGPYRVNPAREFFRIEVEQAVALINVFPGEDVTRKTERAVEAAVERAEPGSLAAVKRFKKDRPNMNFEEMGVPFGAEIVHIKSGEIAVVAGAKKVTFRGEVISLTEAQRRATGVEHAVQPSPHWSYEGERLIELYERTYPREAE